MCASAPRRAAQRLPWRTRLGAAACASTLRLGRGEHREMQRSAVESSIESIAQFRSNGIVSAGEDRITATRAAGRCRQERVVGAEDEDAASARDNRVVAARVGVLAAHHEVAPSPPLQVEAVQLRVIRVGRVNVTAEHHQPVAEGDERVSRAGTAASPYADHLRPRARSKAYSQRSLRKSSSALPPNTYMLSATRQAAWP
eukprot:CAMPEP_0179846984 /NCGR_PEP_ID=MMETSP0982-20121206/5840_1 /TAXON_ID=483367 /ORGANISM="non described non described, Strain CCMP 2436" /LENGTH=199 /DNA_ID=CAMNT_0021732137 /DNA_START=77 /DNA_END=675 /DNA_ORIENTATION=-